MNFQYFFFRSHLSNNRTKHTYKVHTTFCCIHIVVTCFFSHFISFLVRLVFPLLIFFIHTDILFAKWKFDTRNVCVCTRKQSKAYTEHQQKKTDWNKFEMHLWLVGFIVCGYGSCYWVVAEHIKNYYYSYSFSLNIKHDKKFERARIHKVHLYGVYDSKHAKAATTTTANRLQRIRGMEKTLKNMYV